MLRSSDAALKIDFTTDDMTLVTFQVRNIPDSMHASDLYKILKYKYENIIEVKIKSWVPRENKKAIHFGSSIQALVMSLNVDPSMNNCSPLEILLDKMKKKDADSVLIFGEEPCSPEYSLKTIMNKYTNSKEVNGEEAMNSNFEDARIFILRMRDLYKQNSAREKDKLRMGQNKSQVYHLPPVLSSNNSQKKFPKINSKGVNPKDLQDIYPTKERRFAELSILEKSSVIRRLKKQIDEKFLIDDIHPIYLGLQEARRQHEKEPFLEKCIKMISKNHIVDCENIEFGIFHPRDLQTFCCYWNLKLLRGLTGSTSLIYDKGHGRIAQKFQIIFEVPSLSSFVKIEFNLKMIQKYTVQKSSKDYISLYFHLDYSPRFSYFQNKDEMYKNELFSESWERIPSFALDPKENLILSTYLSQMAVIKITVNDKDSNPKMKSLIDELKNIESKNLSEENYKNIYLFENPPFLNDKILKDSSLSYEAKYAILACISQRKIDLFAIDSDFLKHLEGSDPAIVEKTLRDICSQSASPDFKSLFESLSKNNEISRKLWERKSLLNNVAKTKRVTITPTTIIYHIEEAETSNSVLRRYNEFTNNFLRVALTDEAGEGVKNLRFISQFWFRSLMKNLIIIDHKYEFLAFSASQLRTNAFWMVKATSNISADKIRSEIGNLENIMISAKYGARLGQLLSSSSTALKITDRLKVSEEQDILTSDGKYKFSDGVGKISINLRNEIRIKMKIRDKFSAIQIRLGGAKGILVVDRNLPDDCIVLRQSMIKFEESKFDDTLELIDYSKYRGGYLNRQIILLLLTNGLDSKVLIELQDEYIHLLSKKEVGEVDRTNLVANQPQFSPTKELILDCVNANIDIYNEPFVRGVLETVRIRSLLNLKEKSNILIQKAARLTGILDEYNVLKSGEIYVCVSPSNGVDDDFIDITAKHVLVTKNPCLHPGDIRVLNFVNSSKVKEAFKGLINCIIFPAVGPRPHTDEIAGSDLDGDMYFISWDDRLIPKKRPEPMSYIPGEPLKEKVTIDSIISFFIEFTNNDALGRIDNSHLAFGDEAEELAASKKCRELAELHAIAVDYAKSGVCPTTYKQLFAEVFPDYMERGPDKSFESPSALGNLYRIAKYEIDRRGIGLIYKKGMLNSIFIDKDFIVEGFECYLGECVSLLEEYYKDAKAIMTTFNIQTEYEIYSGKIYRTEKKIDSGLNIEKLTNKLTVNLELLKEKFCELFYEEFGELSTLRDSETAEFTPELLKKSSALYVVSYFNSVCESEALNEVMKHFSSDLAKLIDHSGAQMIGLAWLIAKNVLIEVKRSKVGIL